MDDQKEGPTPLPAGSTLANHDPYEWPMDPREFIDYVMVVGRVFQGIKTSGWRVIARYNGLLEEALDEVDALKARFGTDHICPGCETPIWSDEATLPDPEHDGRPRHLECPGAT